MRLPTLRTTGTTIVIAAFLALPASLLWPYVGFLQNPSGSPFTARIGMDKAVCGNGKVESSERCDDRNGVMRDGCTSCLIDGGHACNNNVQPSRCIRAVTQRCGDGLVDVKEACDDGNLKSGDGCSRVCKKE